MYYQFKSNLGIAVNMLGNFKSYSGIKIQWVDIIFFRLPDLELVRETTHIKNTYKTLKNVGH